MEPKTQCKWCGEEILLRTARALGGRCVPCSKKSWFRHIWERFLPGKVDEPPSYDAGLSPAHKSALAQAFQITDWSEQDDDIVELIYDLDDAIFVDWRGGFDDTCASLKSAYPADFDFEHLDHGPPERARIIDAHNRTRTFEHAHDNTKDPCSPAFFNALNRFYEGRLVFLLLEGTSGSDTMGYIGRAPQFWSDLQAKLGKHFKKVFSSV